MYLDMKTNYLSNLRIQRDKPKYVKPIVDNRK